MRQSGEVWGLVLAGGEGTRLSAVTAAANGDAIPKQYCSLVDSRTLLRATLDRMCRLVSRRRIVVVVSERHRRHWAGELADWPRENVVAQPENRGTATGLLLPLLTIAGRDPLARVVVTPSDHFIADEIRFLGAVTEGLAALDRPEERILLLGVAPDRPEAGYGWVVPRRDTAGSPMPVERFVEKPEAAEARELARRGGVWNSFVLVSRLLSLLELYASREPELLHEMTEVVLPRRPHADRERAMRELFARLAPRDFSRHLLAGAEDRLAVLPVPPCGWTDLGTPERLAQVLRRRFMDRASAVRPRAATGPDRAARRPEPAFV